MEKSKEKLSWVLKQINRLSKGEVWVVEAYIEVISSRDSEKVIEGMLRNKKSLFQVEKFYWTFSTICQLLKPLHDKEMS